MIERQRLLSVAVASRKIAYVLLIDGRLKDWLLSRAGGMSAPKGRSFLRMAIARNKPDLVVIENPFGTTRKHGTSREILLALAQELEDGGVTHRLVTRKQAHANKYDEAVALAQQFPKQSLSFHDSLKVNVQPQGGSVFQSQVHPVHGFSGRIRL